MMRIIATNLGFAKYVLSNYSKYKVICENEEGKQKEVESVKQAKQFFRKKENNNV